MIGVIRMGFHLVRGRAKKRFYPNFQHFQKRGRFKGWSMWGLSLYNFVNFIWTCTC